jgi:transcription antitermination factor NusG
VVRVLKAGDEPAHLGDDVVANIRSREIGGFVRLPKKQTALRPGQAVRIMSGQFRGHEALYDGQSPQERERVLLDMLGGRTRVELAKGDRVEAIELAS